MISTANGHTYDGEEEPYLITIQYYPSDDEVQSSLFKTRGRHLVEKVLRMACKTFKIDYDKER